MDTVDLEAYKLRNEVRESHTSHLTDRVEQWTRVRKIGQGDYGKVYLEEDMVGRCRAVKEFSKEIHEAQRHDFLRELFTMARVTDGQAYFAYFHGWYEDEQNVYIAMEYFELGSLRNCVSGPIPEQEIRKIAFQIADALAVLHSQNITHRDVEPENVFVVRKGPHWLVKLGDFGISKHVPYYDTSLHTHYVSQYVAPETLGFVDNDDDDDISYTSAVDIWSLGCLVYWLFTGTVPFQDLVTLGRYCRAKALLPTQQEDIGEQGRDFLRLCLAVLPKERISAKDTLGLAWLGKTNTVGMNKENVSPPGLGVEQSNAPSTEKEKIEQHDGTFVEPVSQEQLEHASLPPQYTAAPAEVLSSSLSSSTLPVPVVWPQPASIESRVAGSSADVIKLAIERPTADQKLQEADSKLEMLHQAIVAGDVEQVTRILDSTDYWTKQKMNVVTKPHGTPLHTSIRNSQAQVTSLLIERGSNVDVRTEDDLPPLMLAVKHNAVECMSLLLAAGAQIEATRIKSGATALILAAYLGHDRCVSKLIQYYANIEATMLEGWTSLGSAATEGHLSTVRLLLQHGANVDGPDVDDKTMTPLTGLAQQGRYPLLVQCLIEAGANIEARTKTSGLTPLHVATIKGHAGIVQLLIKHGADIEARTKISGLTPLHVATIKGHAGIVQLLIKHGADIEAKTDMGTSALKFGKQLNQREVCNLLKGARPKISLSMKIKSIFK